MSAASLFLATLLCWQLLELIVTVSIDDAMYAGWTQHGIKYFFQKNIWHYMNFNGRFLVHFIMQLTVFFEEHLYAVIFPFFISVSTFFITVALKKEWKIYQRLFTTTLALLIYMGLSFKTLTPTAMWIVGGFNYVFPLLLVSLFYCLFLKYRQKTSAMAYLLPLALICGATTEQYGMYTLGLITITYFFDAIERKKLDKRGFAYLFATVLGLLSIMLAPPTLTRFADTTDKPFIEGFLYNWSFFGGEHSSKLFPILFMLLMGLFAAYRRKKTDSDGQTVKYRLYSPLLICGIPFAIVAYIFSAFKNYTVSAIFTFIYVTIAIAIMLKKSETRELGKILLCGFGTWFMMSVTSMASNRTCVPCILSFIIVLTVMFIDAASEASKRLSGKLIGISLAAALTITCCINYITSYEKYKQESIFCEQLYEQMAASKQTGRIEYDWDQTIALKPADYRNMTLVDGYPLTYYQEKFNIPTNVKYIISSNKYKVYNLCCDGLYSQIPAVNKNGSVYVPVQISCLKEGLTDNIKVKLLYGKDKSVIGIAVNDKELSCEERDLLRIGHLYFIRLDQILYQLDYDCRYDTAENTYFFSKTSESN